MSKGLLFLRVSRSYRPCGAPDEGEGVTDIQPGVASARSAGRGFRAYSAKHLDTLVQRWSRDGVNVQAHVHTEQPQNVAKMIVDQAAELGADLIVLSTHGHSGLREKLLGSIAQQVVHEGRVPVLLIPNNQVFGDPP